MAHADGAFEALWGPGLTDFLAAHAAHRWSVPFRADELLRLCRAASQPEASIPAADVFALSSGAPCQVALLQALEDAPDRFYAAFGMPLRKPKAEAPFAPLEVNLVAMLGRMGGGGATATAPSAVPAPVGPAPGLAAVRPPLGLAGAVAPPPSQQAEGSGGSSSAFAGGGFQHAQPSASPPRPTPLPAPAPALPPAGAAAAPPLPPGLPAVGASRPPAPAQAAAAAPVPAPAAAAAGAHAAAAAVGGGQSANSGAPNPGASGGGGRAASSWVATAATVAPPAGSGAAAASVFVDPAILAATRESNKTGGAAPAAAPPRTPAAQPPPGPAGVPAQSTPPGGGESSAAPPPNFCAEFLRGKCGYTASHDGLYHPPPRLMETFRALRQRYSGCCVIYAMAGIAGCASPRVCGCPHPAALAASESLWRRFAREEPAAATEAEAAAGLSEREGGASGSIDSADAAGGGGGASSGGRPGPEKQQQQQQRRLTACVHFLRGACTYGAASHGIRIHYDAAAVEEMRAVRKALPKDGCLAYAFGGPDSCVEESACNYRHYPLPPGSLTAKQRYERRVAAAVAGGGKASATAAAAPDGAARAAAAAADAVAAAPLRPPRPVRPTFSPATGVPRFCLHFLFNKCEHEESHGTFHADPQTMSDFASIRARHQMACAFFIMAGMEGCAYSSEPGVPCRFMHPTVLQGVETPWGRFVKRKARSGASVVPAGARGIVGSPYAPPAAAAPAAAAASGGDKQREAPPGRRDSSSSSGRSTTSSPPFDRMALFRSCAADHCSLPHVHPDWKFYEDLRALRLRAPLGACIFYLAGGPVEGCAEQGSDGCSGFHPPPPPEGDPPTIWQRFVTRHAASQTEWQDVGAKGRRR